MKILELIKDKKEKKKLQITHLPIDIRAMG